MTDVCYRRICITYDTDITTIFISKQNFRRRSSPVFSLIFWLSQDKQSQTTIWEVSCSEIISQRQITKYTMRWRILINYNRWLILDVDVFVTSYNKCFTLLIAHPSLLWFEFLFELPSLEVFGLVIYFCGCYGTNLSTC